MATGPRCNQETIVRVMEADGETDEVVEVAEGCALNAPATSPSRSSLGVGSGLPATTQATSQEQLRCPVGGAIESATSIFHERAISEARFPFFSNSVPGLLVVLACNSRKTRFG